MASFSKFGNDLYTGARSYNIIGRRRIWFSIAGVLILIAILVPVFKGFNFSVEFSGGSEFTVSYPRRVQLASCRFCSVKHGCRKGLRSPAGARKNRGTTWQIDWIVACASTISRRIAAGPNSENT